MIIKIVKRTNPFAQIDRECFEDTRLSWKAKGMLGYLLSRKEDWIVRTTDLINRSQDGRDSVLAGMKELRDCGYAKMEVTRRKGKITGREWVINEVPTHRDTENPFLEKTQQSSRNGFSYCRKTQPVNDNERDTSYHLGNKTKCDREDSPNGSSTFPVTATFFPSSGEYPPFIQKAVHHLETFVRKAKRLNGKKFNRKKWLHDIQLLLQDIEGDGARLKTVLIDYIKSPHDDFTPQVESAESFRRKFAKIEDWLTRRQKEKEKEEKVDWEVDKRGGLQPKLVAGEDGWVR